MSSPGEPICFTCGQPAGSPPRLNRLEDGSACQGCAERVQEALPPALPGFDGMAQSDLPREPQSDWETGPA
ncbi:MAG TPA: hypothetical protein VMS76_14750 [Planctomycetota bacterium]|nr:hypothetical protein [Planctomycetota bacterium]